MSFSALQKRCIQLAFEHQLCHVSSALNTVTVLDGIYANKREQDIVVLGNAHAALALYAVLEKYAGQSADALVSKHGTHATRDPGAGIFVSGGSLGQAETIAVGMAIADPSRTVYLVTSDGACMEGCVFESMRIAAENCHNLVTHLIYNGFGAYRSIPITYAMAALWGDHNDVFVHHCDQLPRPLSGLAAHYAILTRQQYEELTA